VVDGQNAADPTYQSMLSGDIPQGHAFKAASDLVMNGVAEPSGYTEPGLHRQRRDWKAAR
jgi:malate synthase